MSAYDLAIRMRADMARASILLWGLTLLSIPLAFFSEVGITVPVLFCLLAMHAQSIAQAAQVQAKMQAALDMKRMMLRHDDPAIATGCQTIRLRGEPLELRARDGTRFDITLVGLDLDGEHADIRTRYFG